MKTPSEAQEMREARARLREMIREYLPGIYETLCELMVCPDPKVREKAKAFWRAYGPRMRDELQRRGLLRFDA
jgi:hypothetical protein